MANSIIPYIVRAPELKNHSNKAPVFHLFNGFLMDKCNRYILDGQIKLTTDLIAYFAHIASHIFHPIFILRSHTQRYNKAWIIRHSSFLFYRNLIRSILQVRMMVIQIILLSWHTAQMALHTLTWWHKHVHEQIRKLATKTRSSQLKAVQTSH